MEGEDRWKAGGGGGGNWGVEGEGEAVEEEERIKAELFEKHEIKSFKEAGDLSMKVLLVYKCVQ